MVEDIKPSGGGSEQNKKPENLDSPGEEFPGLSTQVDSLVDNNAGSVGTNNANSQTNPIQGKVRKFFSFGMRLWPSSKKEKIIGSALAAVILVGGIGGVYALKKLADKPLPDPAPITFEHPPKTTEPSRLTGVEIPIKTNERLITSIQIENSPDARPQSGLRDAGIVFEAIAEGGITRFNAVFLEGQPGYIGPVRSIRPYYIDLFLPFDASIVHAGGSGAGLSKIQKLRVKDIDHGPNAEAFQRVGSRTAPHNLYTSMKALDKVSKKRKFKMGKITSWPRKKESPSATPTATKINFVLSGFLYDPQFSYDKKSNSYKRSQAGKPHTDEKSRKQLQPKVVVALVMKYSQSGIYSVYKTKGEGTMFVFQDGIVQKGKWKKGESKSQFEFFDSNGKTLALNPGQTWVTLVADKNRVKYKP